MFGLITNILASPPLLAGPLNEGTVGLVAAVVDGDTIVVEMASRRRAVRLCGIDAPEAGQPFGSESRDALNALVQGGAVSLQFKGTDRHGRAVAILTRGDTDVNLAMVRNGWAWHAARFDRRRSLRDAQAAARRDKRGLWAHDRPTPPWEWRRKRARCHFHDGGWCRPIARTG